MTQETNNPPYPTGTFYGHTISPKLTPEQKQEVIKLLAKGLSVRKITEELGVSVGRVKQVKANKAAAEAAAQFQATRDTPKMLNALQEGQDKMIALMTTLVTEIQQMKTVQGKHGKALMRRQLELKAKTETARELKRQKQELAKLVWNQTGRKPL